MSDRREKKRERRLKRLAKRNKRRVLGSPKAKAAVSNQRFQMQVPLDRLKPSGIPSELHFVASEKPGPSSEDAARLNDSREREFQVYAQLGTTIALAPRDITFTSFDPRQGTSLLKVPPIKLPPGATPIGFFLTTPAGKVQLHVNTNGEVSGAEFSCRARSRSEVFALVDQHVTPFLDHISYLYDVPLFVQSVTWVDALNNTWGARCTMPYGEVNAGLIQGGFPPDLRAFYGLYREALGNPSVFYQFLCFCKILEGTFRWKLPKVFEEAKGSGIELKRSTPTVPLLNPLTPSEVKAYEGTSIADAFTNFLEPQFRHAVAHFKEDGEDPLQVTDYLAHARIIHVLELARVCARAAISMLEAYIAQLKR